MTLTGNILKENDNRAYLYSTTWNSDTYPYGGPSMVWTHGDIKLRVYGGARGPSDIYITPSLDCLLTYYTDTSDTTYTVYLKTGVETFICNSNHFEGTII